MMFLMGSMSSSHSRLDTLLWHIERTSCVPCDTSLCPPIHSCGPHSLTSYIAPPRAVEGQESTFRYILVPFRYLALCSTASLSLNRRNFTKIVGGRVLALPLGFPIQPSCSCTRCKEDQILAAGSVGICGLLTRGLAW